MPNYMQKRMGLFGRVKKPKDEDELDALTNVPKKEGLDSDQKKGLFDRLKSSFGAKTVGGEVDPKTGVPSPVKEERGAGRKILDYALPAILSMSAGAGPLPGILSALKGSAGRRAEERESITDFGKKSMTAKSSADKLALEEGKYKDLQDYRTKKLGIDKLRALRTGTDTNKPVDYYSALSKEEQDELAQLTDEELRAAMRTGDKDKKSAARYVWEARGRQID